MIRQYGYRIEKVDGNIATIIFPDFIKHGTSTIKLNIKKVDVLNEMVYLLTEFVAQCLKEFCPNIPSDEYKDKSLCPIIIAVQAGDGKMYPTGYHEKIYTQVFPVDFSKTPIIDFHLFGTSFVDFYDEGIENSVTFTYEQKANKEAEGGEQIEE